MQSQKNRDRWNLRMGIDRKFVRMKVIIVGGVAGGASCAARLRRLDEYAEIIMVERGPYISYANCGLPNLPRISFDPCIQTFPVNKIQGFKPWTFFPPDHQAVMKPYSNPIHIRQTCQWPPVPMMHSSSSHCLFVGILSGFSSSLIPSSGIHSSTDTVL